MSYKHVNYFVVYDLPKCELFSFCMTYHNVNSLAYV